MKNDEQDILAVDKFALDVEWVRQPSLYGEFAKKATEARQTMDDAKARLEVVKAELILDILNHPENYDAPKTTEKVLDAIVTGHPMVREAVQEFNTARHDYEIYQGLLASLDHKKKALENLVALQGRDYFSQPVAPKEGREAMERAKKKATRGGGRKRKRQGSDDDGVW